MQPDIVMICDTSILDDKVCNGLPDLVVEVLSPSTIKKEFNEKYNIYEENGVKESWLIHLELKIAETYVLKDQKFHLNLRLESANGVITSPLFPDFKLDCSEVFKD